MEITLTPDLEELISQKVDSGKYNSASELIQASLKRMFSEEETRQTVSDGEKRRKVENLRREIMKGVEQIRNGEGIVIEVDDLDNFADEIIRRGLERRQNAGEN